MCTNWYLDAGERLAPTSSRLLPPGGPWPGATRIHLGTLTQRVRLLQVVGLVGLAVICWLDELGLAWLAQQFPALASAAAGKAPALHAVWEALCVLPFLLLVQVAVRACLARARYLEGHIPYCPHCRQVESGGHWMTLAEFIDRNSELRLTELYCQHCLPRR